jgi:hypothetical protein
MHKFMRGAAAVVVCAAFGMADLANTASAGAHGFHGYHGFRGFYGLYPYTLFGYPNYYSYGGYYPYSLYDDSEPNCDFVWAKRTAKHKTAGRGIWTCS